MDGVPNRTVKLLWLHSCTASSLALTPLDFLNLFYVLIPLVLNPEMFSCQIVCYDNDDII